MRFAGILDHFLCFGRAYLRWRFSIGDCAVQPFLLNHCLSIVLFGGEDVQFDPHVCFKLVKPSPAYRLLLDRVAPKRGHFPRVFMW